MQQAYTRMKNKNNFTEEASFYSRRCLFLSVQQWHYWATVKTREGAGAMFCSSCGTECPLSAKFCGHCGHRINDVTQNTTRKVDEGGVLGGASIPLTFKQFKSKKEENRKGYFRNNSVILE